MKLTTTRDIKKITNKGRRLKQTGDNKLSINHQENVKLLKEKQ